MLKRLLAATVAALAAATPATAQFVINPTFTSNFDANFGSNAAAARAAWIAAANTFSANYNDPITVNITVDAVAGTSVFGQSGFGLISSDYNSLRNAVVSDAKTANDATAIGSGGSMVGTDPITGTHTWWVSRAQAKALGLIASDGANDGMTRFGAGNPFTFSGPIAAGTFDFKGVALHEISEVLGRNGISGGTIGSSPNSYSLLDNFSYKAAGVKGVDNGAGNNFSFDNGTTLLKLFNNAASNGLDSRDWAPGTNDAFNQFETSGTVNGLSDVDLQLMDVLGYDLVAVPEPSGLLALAVVALGLRRFRNRYPGRQFTE
jgi:hypothetical protein